MDEIKLKNACIALGWEARYHKGEHLVGKGAFLPDLDSLDQDFVKALEFFGVQKGRLLDIGTGLGMQAIRYAQSGFDVTATDASSTSIETARNKAAEQGMGAGSVTFIIDNILGSAVDGLFDVITDRGCYTLLKDWMFEDYCRTVHRLLSPEGLFLLKVDAKRYEKIEPLKSRFCIVQSWDTHYHGAQRQGPKAGFFILKPVVSIGLEC